MQPDRKVTCEGPDCQVMISTADGGICPHCDPELVLSSKEDEKKVEGNIRTPHLCPKCLLLHIERHRLRLEERSRRQLRAESDERVRDDQGEGGECVLVAVGVAVPVKSAGPVCEVCGCGLMMSGQCPICDDFCHV